MPAKHYAQNTMKKEIVKNLAKKWQTTNQLLYSVRSWSEFWWTSHTTLKILLTFCHKTTQSRSRLQMTRVKVKKHVFNTKICELCVEVSRVLLRCFTKQISRVLCSFAMEAVTFQNTKEFCREEVDGITSLTIARENSTNCETCVSNSHVCTSFSWNSHETCMQLFRL